MPSPEQERPAIVRRSRRRPYRAQASQKSQIDLLRLLPWPSKILSRMTAGRTCPR